MKDLKYKNMILELSERLNELQKPIQILDAIKWDESIEQEIITSKFKELPVIDYEKRPLKYDAQKKIQDFKELRLKITRELGSADPIGQILIRNCLQYEDVVRMLQARGKPQFYNYSQKLYGSPSEIMEDGKTKLSDMAHRMRDLLNGIDENLLGEKFERTLSSQDVVDQLSVRLSAFFPGEKIKIKLSDGIISDASAGSDYIKIKNGLKFSQKDLDIFEVHEGWVHLGTTINGQQQPFAKWLAKGPPCSTVTQEGLAVIMELFNFAMFPRRAKRLNDRLFAAHMAEEGADLLEVIEFFRTKGQEEKQAIKNAARVFRGAPLTGGSPFTKDISYLKGFVMIFNFMQSAIRNQKAELIPFLFAGKATLEDVPVLYEYFQEGLISEPKYLPPQIKDLNGLAIWMAFSNFLNTMRVEDIEAKSRADKTAKIKLIA